MKARSGKRHSLEASLALARLGSGPTPQQRERVGQALRGSGLAVPVIVAGGITGVAQAAATAANTGAAGNAAAGYVTGNAAVGSSASAATAGGGVAGSVGSVAGSMGAASSASGTVATAATFGGKWVAVKVVALKLASTKGVAALAVASASALGLGTGYEVLTTKGQTSSPSHFVAAPQLVAGPKLMNGEGKVTATAAPTTGGNELRASEPTASLLSGNLSPTVLLPSTANAPALAAAKSNEPSVKRSARAPSSPKSEASREASAQAFSAESGSTKPLDPVQEDPIVVEMQHLKQANRALASGNPTLALEHLNALDQTMPKGALLQERQVSRVKALCALGDTDRAVTLTQRLLRQNDSFYSASLKHSCGFRP